MSNQDNVLGCIRRLLWARFGVPTADVSLTTTIEDVGIDSLDAVELVMELEKRFDVTITDHEASQWTTVEDVVASIRAKTGGEPGAALADLKRQVEEADLA